MVGSSVSILASLVSERVWILHSSLELVLLYRKALFSPLTIRLSTKEFYNALNIDMDYRTNYKADLIQGFEGSGLEWGIEFLVRS